MEQSLKVMVVLGVTVLVLNSCGWPSWSYVVVILCLDTDKTRVNKILIFDILLIFAAESEKNDCVRAK